MLLGEECLIDTWGKRIKLEAENGNLIGLTIGVDEFASGGRFVEGFDTDGDRLSLHVELHAAGTYMIVIRYKTFGGDKPNNLELNGVHLAHYTFKEASSWKDAIIGQYELRQGLNTFDIVHAWGWICVDNVTLIGGPVGPVRHVQLLLEDGQTSGPADAPIVLTAIADHAAEYRFMARLTNGEWIRMNEFSMKHHTVWLPLGVGRYLLKAVARGLGSSIHADVEAVMEYEALPEHANKPLVSPIFGSGMVLQRHKNTMLWGWAVPGTVVTVKINEDVVTAQVGNNSRWQASIGSYAAGGPYTIEVSNEKESVLFEQVLFGDVWLSSGQSNMEWKLSQTVQAAEEVAAADYPNLRFIRFPSRPSAVPLSVTDERHRWTVVKPDTASELSAVAYFFARKVMKETGIPIGIVFSAVGGTKIEPWISREALRKDPAYITPTDNIRYGIDPVDPFVSPTVMYNGMIAPIAPFGLKGVLWYQGESNSGELRYNQLLPMLLEDWRHAFGDKQLPFVLIQLASYGELQSKEQPVQENAGFAIVREAQLHAVLHDPRAGLVVTTDVGNPADIHPANKQDVGKRAALCALGSVYGHAITYSGPIYQSVSVEDSRMRVRFEHVGSGLMAGVKDGLNPVIEAPDRQLLGFAIAGLDELYNSANAVIDGDTVLVHSDQVPHPVYVRYGWADSSIGNLYNREGLPASPFRTV